MECTQRLECTQYLHETRVEKTCPEQIGFLGICGTIHPIKRGPNKIGRDPQTCSIVLNLNSISRQHAVINVLNKSEFMLMDLDSANKTKLMDKTLPAYIPHPLRNGDMVQFGDVFGVFRLLEDDNDLPMTQAIDIPETPVAEKHVSRFIRVPATTVPESPDVSDKEESFIAPSQPKATKCFKNSNDHFIKPSSKIISIQPLGSSKIDNIFWSSSKRSVSLNSDLGDCLNDSTLSHRDSTKENEKSIYEMETQPPPAEPDESVDSIYTAETQAPNASPSIHSANTQLPQSVADIKAPNPVSAIENLDTQLPPSMADIYDGSPSIHSLNTQLPETTLNLPEVCKVDSQQDMQFDLYTPKKICGVSISDAETQAVCQEDARLQLAKNETPPSKDIITEKAKNNLSGEEDILFDDVDGQFDDNFESQALLPPGPLENLIKNRFESAVVSKDLKRDVIIHSDSSTDCEDFDILPTQKITEKKVDDEDDLTDCEDLFSEMPKNIKPVEKVKTKNESFEDMSTQVIDDVVHKIKVETNDVNLEDMLTQVIVTEPSDKIAKLEDLPTQVIVSDDDVIISEKETTFNDDSFENLPTQVIVETIDVNAQVQNVYTKTAKANIPSDLISPFKIPLISPIKNKRKDVKVTTPNSNKPIPIKNKSPSTTFDDDDNYYAATQDIIDDLCTQKETSPEPVNEIPKKLQISIEINKHEHFTKPKRRINSIKSSESSDGDDKINTFVSNLSNQQIREMVGVEPQVAGLKKMPSDPSDSETTPKKVRPIKFMDIDLPNSQEIKTSVSLHSKIVVTESSSESEIENDSEECTPILFRKRKKPKVDAKIDLTKVFEADSLPTRVITRVRKPTSKYQNSDDVKRITSNILKPKFLTEQEEDIDKDIITENLSRLKNKSEKSKNKDKTISPTNNKTIDAKTNADKSKIDIDKENAKTGEEKEMIETKKCRDTRKPGVKRNDSYKSKDKPESSKKVAEDVKVIEKDTTRKKSERNATKRNSNKDSTDNENTSAETSTISKSIRSTRNRRKVDVKTEVVEKDKVEKSKRSRTNRKENVQSNVIASEEGNQNMSKHEMSKRQDTKKSMKTDCSEVVEVRRSSRRKKENVQTEKIKPVRKQGKAPKHEQSTVYSISSESGTESPRNSKRSATADLKPPSPKRTRSAITSNSSMKSTSARANKTECVLFTAFSCDEVRTVLENLGAVMVSDLSTCTVVVTLQVKRTFKLLCAVGLGRPIVGPSWVQACSDNKMLVDPWQYILKDESAEQRFHFDLERTLLGKRNFLKGFNVSATPSVMPSAPEMKLIVEYSGGVWKDEGPNWVCVSCTADKPLWPVAKRKGATVVSTEFILGGVLKQKADVAGCKIF